ncbi:MAG: hypothetical protein LBH12_06550, partial [Dysgonamonadaceae bacterium]|nr:hypothetical protein [Dysgonamonadaceae bacterium]
MKKFCFTIILSIIFVFIFSNGINAQSIDDSLYPFHPEENVSFSSSNLPIVVINLNERMADKEEDRRVSAEMIIVHHTDGSRNNISDTVSSNHANSEIINYAGKIGI